MSCMAASSQEVLRLARGSQAILACLSPGGQDVYPVAVMPADLRRGPVLVSATALPPAEPVEPRRRGPRHRSRTAGGVAYPPCWGAASSTRRR